MKTKVHLKRWEFGKGDVKIIFLHGFPLDHTIWHPVLPYLQDMAHCVLPDLRGHGESPDPDGIYTMPLMAEDVADLMDELDIDRAILVGHSMGGYISLAFAKAYPQRLLALALVATHPLADNENKRQSRLRSAEIIEKTGIEGLAADMPNSLTTNAGLRTQIQKIIQKTSPQGAASALRGMAEREDTSSFLGQIQVPTVVIAGEKDSIVPLTLATEMASKLPKGKLAVVPNGGHMPMMEAPEQTADALADLINRVGRTNT